ncbi:F-box/kelch-repeat protein At3g23880-like [Vicia villosa]|uniref:F-box/kelch-repeat protein At3g23880-like n=1 Tax=Vicia villosa TaxID=3911 RepID=UPI00273B37A6|nr:F-box/kelch-repeat protein At3g23880-like [Vicia villosa]
MTHPQTFLCEDLLIEIFSKLPIKSLLRFQCLSNSLKSLISNPIFVKLHLLNSRKNTNILLEFTRFFKETLTLVDYSLSSIVNDFRFDSRLKYKFEVVGSCNGLVCLVTQPSSKREKYLVCLWNPITKSKSYKPRLLVHSHSYSCITIFGFGYDSLSDTYKVVVAHFNSSELVQGSIQSEVTIYNNRDNCWRNIQSFPGFPILGETRGLYLNDTINWVATSIVDYSWNYSFYIVSLHLGNETYKQLSLPSCFGRARPSLGILKDHLCASYDDSNTTHFNLWQMNEYGVESSWTKLLKLSYARGTFKNDRLILIKMIDGKLQATTVYRQEGNIVILRKKKLWTYTKDYVPSLVAP